MKEKNQGITLIALIMTIIILLILATISVNVVIKGDLFRKAGEAADKTNEKIGYQQNRVDELMNDLYTVEENMYGPEIGLKYYVIGTNIKVYLKDSYYDFFSTKTLEEKENQISRILLNGLTLEEAAEQNGSTIDELINKIGLNSYEELVDALAIQCFEGDFCNYNPITAKKTLTEKENTIAKSAGYNNLSEYLAAQNKTKDEWFEENKNGNITYEEFISTQFVSIELRKEENSVTVVKPNGEETVINYWSMSILGHESEIVNYKVDEDGDYIFKAYNTKGRTAQMTVPVKLQKGTFTLKDIGTNEILGTFEFVKGQTWGEFLEEERTINGVKFSKNDAKLYKFRIQTQDELYNLLIIEENEVSIQDKIIDGVTYNATVGYE